MTRHTNSKPQEQRPVPVPLLEPSLSNWRLPRPGQTSPSWRLSK